MILKCDCEFRGKEVKQNEKGTYYYITLETASDDGEALKLSSVDFSDFIKDIKKGDKVTAFVDYNVQYKSLKIVDMVKFNGKQ